MSPPREINDDREPSLTKDEMTTAMGFDPFDDPSKLSDGDSGEQKAEPAKKDDSEVQAGEADKPEAEPSGRDDKGRFVKKADDVTPEAEAPGEPEPPVKTAPKETPEPEPEKVEKAPELKAAEATIELLQKSNKTMQAAVDRLTAQPPAQAPAAAPAATTPPVPDYTVNLPDDLMDGLASEDAAVRKANMNALIKGTAQVIHRTVMQHVEQRINQVVPAMVTGQAHEISEQERIHKSFYGKYPHLVGAQAIVGQEAVALAAETGAGVWDDAFRDAVHARVMQVLQGTRVAAPAAEPAVAPVAAAGNGAKPPATRRSGTRPTAAPDGPNSAVDIEDTLFGGA